MNINVLNLKALQLEGLTFLFDYTFQFVDKKDLLIIHFLELHHTESLITTNQLL